MLHVNSSYNNVLIKYILCSNVYEPSSHLRDGGGCILVGRNTLLKKKLLLCRETSLADFAVLALQIRPPQIFCILNFKAVVKILKFQICLHSCLTLGSVESKGRDGLKKLRPKILHHCPFKEVKTTAVPSLSPPLLFLSPSPPSLTLPFTPLFPLPSPPPLLSPSLSNSSPLS
jgi:hypothetical protein